MNIVAFEVHRDANKIEVKRAVEDQFKVKVAEVRIARVHGKVRRQGRFAGRRPDWKKAYVRLADGRKADRVLRGDVSDGRSRRESRSTRRAGSRPTSRSTEVTSDRPHKPLTKGKHSVRRPQQHRPADRLRGAAAVTSGSTATIDFKRDKHGVPAKVAASSTTRTARRASRCCTTPTARSATSSGRTALRSAPR